jgi:putative transposase
MDQRMRFVLTVEKRVENFAEICRRFGVSRKTGYKWLARYLAQGPAGLLDQSRAPHQHPQAVSAAIAERCAAVRRAHPSWGPVKVGAWLRRRQPDIMWPATSTIGELFDREGLTVKRRLRRRSPPSSGAFCACPQAMIWGAAISRAGF